MKSSIISYLCSYYVGLFFEETERERERAILPYLPCYTYSRKDRSLFFNVESLRCQRI